MKALPKKLKFNTKTTSIIVGIILIGLIIPNIAWASLWDNIAKAIFEWMINIILSLVGFLVSLAAGFFEAMLDVGFDKNQSVAEIGWRTTRDFSNMLFILFMIIIAFATILRVERYGIKKLLPKVIGIALLINFSLIFCYLIIDLSNVVSQAFIKSAQNEALKLGDKASLSGALVTALKLTSTFLPKTCQEAFDEQQENCDEIEDMMEKNKCWENAKKESYRCAAAEGYTKPPDETFLDVIVSGILSITILFVAAFVLFAAGVLLVIRMIFIWFLVMLSPIVFLCYIMPGLQKNWQKWWHSFTSWCIFAPAYTFFVWLAVKVAVEKKITPITAPAANLGGGEGVAQIVGFFRNSVGNLMGYLLILGLLVGGLIAAKQLGIYGADTAMKIGQKWGKGLAARTTRYPRELATAVGAGTMQQLGGALKKIPGFKKFGRSLETRGTALYRKPMEDKAVKAYEKQAEISSDPNLLSEIKERTGVFALAAVQIAIKRGLLQKTEDRDAVRTGIGTLRGYGFEKEAGDLEEARFSVIEDENKRKQTIKKVKAKGTDSALRPEVFKDNIQKGETAGQEAAREFILDEPTISAAVERGKKLRRDTQKQLSQSLARGFIDNNNFRDSDNKKVRWAYAAMTGDLRIAFWDKQNKRVNRDALGEFVTGMTPQNFTDIPVAYMKDIAEFVSAATAFDASRNLSEDKKRALIDEWKRMVATGHPKAAEAQKTLDDLRLRPAWASLIT